MARRAPPPLGSLRTLRRLTDTLVLEADPQLAAEIPPSQRARAIAASRAPVRVFTTGAWKFESSPERASLGALILAGMVLLRMDAWDSSHLEVLGPGDVLNPWLSGGETTLHQQVSVHVVQSGCVALLDRRFALQMSPWPEVFGGLMRRQILRTRRMILQASILSRPRVDERLELMLWRLADQFGRMTRDGLHVRLPFTHLQLAQMIAAQRSTVTLAISRLVADDRLRRPARHEWLLPHHELTRLTTLADEPTTQLP